jgi:regulator of cell morphogenesis and NO signaling
LVAENFDIEHIDKEASIAEICRKKGINTDLFLLVSNLHNGFYTNNFDFITPNDLPSIIRYLKRGHDYYRLEKYPEIVSLIHEIKKHDSSGIIAVIDAYFNEYFGEVVEHIDYEENIAFPYFLGLAGYTTPIERADYSTDEYREHHTDIESKLETFKDFFIHHLNDKTLAGFKRKILLSIAELEFELKIHAHIEDTILIPLTTQLEN